MKYLKVYLKFLDDKDKNFFSVIVILTFIGVLLEIFSLGLLVPILSGLTNENFSNNLISYNFLLEYFYEPSIDELNNFVLLKFFMLFFFLIYLIKIIYLIFLSYIQYSFTWSLYFKTSNKFFKQYISKDYSILIKKNTSEIIRNLSIQLIQLTSYSNSILFLFCDFLIITGIFFLLFIINFKFTLFIFIIFGCFAVTYSFFIKKSMTKAGNDRKKYDYKLLENLKNTFNNFKFIFLRNLEPNFIENHYKYSKKLSSSGFTQNFTASFPKNLIELIAIFSLLISLIFIFDNSVSLIPLLGIYAAAAFRVLPTISRILVSITHIQALYPILENLITQTQGESNHQKKENFPLFLEDNFNDDILIKDLSFSYGDKTIFENLNLKINNKSFIGIMGLSGSGKTTFINLLMGFISPNEGSINIGNKNISSIINNWQSSIGYVSQNTYLKDDTIKNNVAYGIKEHLIDEQKVIRSLKKANLFFNEKKINLNMKVGEFGSKISGGQIQRIAIARTLYCDSNILIFDESTNALDDKTEKKLIETISKLKNTKTIIFVSHKKSSLNLCDKIYSIKDKKLEEI